MLSRKFTIEIRPDVDVVSFNHDGIQSSEALGILIRHVIIGAVKEVLDPGSCNAELKRKFNSQQTKAKQKDQR